MSYKWVNIVWSRVWIYTLLLQPHSCGNVLVTAIMTASKHTTQFTFINYEFDFLDLLDASLCCFMVYSGIIMVVLAAEVLVFLKSEF